MYTFKVDSCALSIPLSKCEIVDQELQDHFRDIRINETTGEATEVKAYQGKPFKIDYEDGISVKIWIETQITYDTTLKKKSNEKYITLLANSKHLKSDYFKGITKETIKQHYDFIMSLNAFKCPYSSYINARYSDIDICFDFKCNEENFIILKENIKKSALEPLYFHTTNEIDNSGIWTPTRSKPRDQATPSKPYIKFYSKELDFLNKSRKFATKYVDYKEYKDVVRYECTIKNSKHKKRLNVNNYPTFISFLNSDLQFIGKQIFAEYFKKAKFVKSIGLKPMDKAVIDMINDLIEYGAPKTKIQGYFDRYDVSPKARLRLLDKYHKFYAENVINKERMEANQITKNVFEFLGVDLSQTKIDFED